MIVNVDGHSWALCSIEETKSPRILTPLNKDFIPVTDSPLVVQQHNIPPQKFVLLSAQVCFIFPLMTLCDILHALLLLLLSSPSAGESHLPQAEAGGSVAPPTGEQRWRRERGDREVL